MNTVQAQLIGSWTTELDNDGTPALGLVAFSADGGVTSTQLNTKHIGLGTWRATGESTFEYAFHILASDDEGKHVGEARIHVEGEIVDDGTWVGTGGATFYNPEGKSLRGHGGSKVVAKKFGIGK